MGEADPSWGGDTKEGKKEEPWQTRESTSPLAVWNKIDVSFDFVEERHLFLPILISLCPVASFFP